MNDFDFFIPPKYRGQKIVVQEKIVLQIPSEAHYLNVNTLEDEEEFLGFQDDSDRQEIQYTDANKKYLSSQDFEHEIITWLLMSELERILKKV